MSSTSSNDISVVHSEQYITSIADDGTVLYVQKWSCCKATTKEDGKPPSIKVKAELLIVHGYLEHSNRYEEFARYLCCNYNINVTAYDLRGHGKSSGMPRAHVDVWSKYHDDMETVLSTLPTTTGASNAAGGVVPVPHFLLGHSTGGLFSIEYVLRDDTYKNKKHVLKSLSGIVTTSAFLQPDDGIPAAKRYGAKILGGIFPALSIPADVIGENLTNDQGKLEEWKNDKVYLHYATIGWGKQAMEAQAWLKDLVDNNNNKSSASSTTENNSSNPQQLQFPLPLLYIYGGNDKIAGPKTAKEMANAIQTHDKTIICRENEPHEVLNNQKRIELYQIIGNWLIQRC